METIFYDNYSNYFRCQNLFSMVLLNSETGTKLQIKEFSDEILE